MQVLRHCFPPSVRQTLDESPETLYETYERILGEIKKPYRAHARRLLQCLVVAVRPLGVKELAEVLAVDFDDAEDIPKLNQNWRWMDEERAVLTLCSSLIAIVESDGSRIVQFSHFSVKEFLTSHWLASSSGDISHYHIDLEPAHTILAQACMSILLRSDHRIEGGGIRNISPLARYAAEHWVVHVQDEKVSSCIRKAMKNLFDVDKPYFAAWLKLYDMDTHPHMRSSSLEWLARGQFRTVRLHRDNGAHVNIHGNNGETPLHSAGDLEIVQLLLEHGTDVGARINRGSTPLHVTVERGWIEGLYVLLEHGGNVRVEDNEGATPLHIAARGNVKIVRILLEHGAIVGAEDDRGTTPLHVASDFGSIEIVRILLERGANACAKDCSGRTPLHGAARHGSIEIVRMLFEHGADVKARSNLYVY